MGLWNRIKAGLAIAATTAGISPAVAEEAPLHTQLETDNAQITACMEEAIETVIVPNGEIHVYAPNNNINNDLLMNGETGEINADGWTHSMGTEITLSDAIGPDYTIVFSAAHEGSLDRNVIDAVNAKIGFDFNTVTGEITNRGGGVNATGRDTAGERLEYTDTAHGRWVVDGVQTLEATFGECMGLTPSNDRPASAATSVGPAPAFMERAL